MLLNGTVPAGDGRSASIQASYQIACLGMTLGMAIVSGIITGLILKLPIFEQIKEEDQFFEDEVYWHIPDHSIKISQVNPSNQI